MLFNVLLLVLYCCQRLKFFVLFKGGLPIPVADVFLLADKYRIILTQNRTIEKTEATGLKESKRGMNLV